MLIDAGVFSIFRRNILSLMDGILLHHRVLKLLSCCPNNYMVERSPVRVTCQAQERNTTSPARAESESESSTGL